ncbi:MAG: alpha/beta hydrolase, partial [Spirochaetales bacterium]
MVRMLPVDNPGPHFADSAFHTGPDLTEAWGAIVLIHGRGASAKSMLPVADHLELERFHIAAPQADGFSWYPYSFLEPSDRNEPGITSGLATIDELIRSFEGAGLDSSCIFLLGFSQGACLAAEYAARVAYRHDGHGLRLGGVFCLSGGVIGAPEEAREYAGSLHGTPVVLGCSDVDMHIPEARVHETRTVLEALDANVDEKIYPGMGHTINQDEIDRMNL